MKKRQKRELMPEIAPKVLVYIKDFYKQFGYMPSLQEIGEAHGKKTRQWASLVLRYLVANNKITFAEGKHRSITIVKRIRNKK